MVSRLALFQSVELVLALAALPATAQAEAPPAAPAATPAEPAATAQVGEVVVTGTRIKGVAPVGSALLTVGRADLEQSNATTISQVFLNMPQVNNLGVSESLRSGNGG